MPIPITRREDNKYPVFRVLDTVGDGSGDTNMAVNGSATPVEFKIKPDFPGQVTISQICVLISDIGNFRADRFGSLSSALANGIDIRVRNPAKTYTRLTAKPIKTNGEWLQLADRFELFEKGFGLNYLQICIDLHIAQDSEIVCVCSRTKDELVVTISDDLRGLTSMEVFVRGYVNKEPNVD